MVDRNSSKRPSANEVSQKIQEEITKIENSKLSQTKRRRFSNKELSSVEGFQFDIKLEDNSSWSENHIKIINEKLLIFPHSKSPKASHIYDITECDVFINEDNYVIVDHPFLSQLQLKSGSEESVKSLSQKLQSCL